MTLGSLRLDANPPRGDGSEGSDGGGVSGGVSLKRSSVKSSSLKPSSGGLGSVFSAFRSAFSSRKPTIRGGKGGERKR